MAYRQDGVTPKHARPRPAHNLLHLFTPGGLVAVYRTLFTGRFFLTKDALIQTLIRIGIQRLIMPLFLRSLRALLLQSDHSGDRLFFP